MRRAKIVCTLGPSAGSHEQLTALVAAGLDIARLNLSHGSYAEHEERYANVRKAADEAGRAVGVLVDLQGPKIRLGTFADGPDRPRARRRVHHHHRGRPRRPEDLLHHLQGPGRGLQARRPHPDRRRPGRPRGAQGRRPAGQVPHRRGRQGLQQQGHQPARRRGLRARADREGHRRPALGARRERGRPARRHDRAVLRAQRQGHRRTCTRSWTSSACACRSSPRWRSRRPSTTSTRSSTPSTPSWSPAATSAWRCRSSRSRWCRSGSSPWPAATPSRSSSPPRCSSR